ncbi:MAG: hypothetical protein KatS3mg032_1372 [Cyclobacteriaceae bacterium]|nr:MAG: hypothetical protein KatS3mg032_1372 [Cyclobacteriaceae bacterium]
MVLVGLMIWGAVSGYQKGFLFMLFALLALVAGAVAGILFTHEVADTLQSHLAVNERYMPYVAFLLIFAVTLLTVRTIGALTRWALHKTFLGGPDKLLGAVLGAIKTACWAGLFLWLLHMALPTVPRWMEESVIYGALTNWYALVLPFGPHTSFLNGAFSAASAA